MPVRTWRDAVVQGLRELADHVDLTAVASVGLSTVFPALLAFDAEGIPLYPAILYADQRSHAQVAWLDERGLRQEIEDRCGGLILPGSTSVTSILWLRDRAPDVFRQTARFGHANTFLVHWLTGEWAIDSGSASLTGLFDPARADWDPTLLAATGLRRDLFPEARSGCDLGGRVSPAAAEQTGLPEGTPVSVGAGDSIGACLGTAVVEPDDALVVGGTTDSLCVCTDEPVPQSGVYLACHAVPHRWLRIAATSYTGGSLTWLARTVGKTDRELLELAGRAAAGAGGLVFLPYLKGERSPILDPGARGALAGLVDSTDLADLARAVLEGAAMAVRHNIEALETGSATQIGEITLVGGPAGSALWNQIKADVCQRPVRTVAFQERSALGAALMGTAASGFVAGYADWAKQRDYTALKAHLGEVCAAQRVYEPNPDRAALYDGLFERYVALYPALKGAGLF